MKKLFIVLALVIFAVPAVRAMDGYGYGGTGSANPTANIEITILVASKITLPSETGYSVGGYLKFDKTALTGTLKIKAFLGDQVLKNKIPLLPSSVTEFCGIGASDSFSCYFSTADNLLLTSDSEISLKFYDSDKYIGETNPLINFKITTNGSTFQPIKDRLKKLTDIDGDGLSGDADKFPTIPNADGKSPIVIAPEVGASVAYDECSASIKNKIKLTPQKTTDPATSTDSYQILIDLPEFGSIKDDADGNTVTPTDEYTFACEEKDADSNIAKDSTPLYGGTIKSSKLSYACTIEGDIKGNEKVPVSFLYEYTDKKGSEPSTCLVTLGKGKEVNLASSVVLDSSSGSPLEGDGGSCALNIAATASDTGWLIDMLIFGLSAGLFGYRRKQAKH